MVLEKSAPGCNDGWMDDRRQIARTAWEIGTLSAGSTAGGRRALARVISLHSDLRGVGESRIVRAAIVAARESVETEPGDEPLGPVPGSAMSLGDRISTVIGVPRVDIETAMAELPADASGPAFEAGGRGAPPEQVAQLRTELDRLYESHGKPACERALRRASNRSIAGSVLTLLVLAAFVGAMIFVVQDLMRGADLEREQRELAEMYSVPAEAVQPAPEP